MAQTAQDKKQKAYKNLDYVVKSFLSEIGETTLHNYERVLQIVIRGYNEMNLYSLPAIKVVYLTVGDNLTVDLPSDYLHYTKIGVNIAGRFVTLGLNKEIVIPKALDACGEALNTGDTTSDYSDYWTEGYYYAPHFRGGQYVGEQFSAGGGFSRYGYYRIDEQNHQIALSSVVAGSQIILEYKSNGMDCEGGTLIPVVAIEPLIEWVHWRMAKANPRRPQSQKEANRRDYIDKFLMMKEYFDSFTMDEFLDTMYTNTKQVPKR